MHGVEPEVHAACKFALGRHGINNRDVVATLLFGSRAKGTANAGSDFDLIFFVGDHPSYPEFSYRRLEFGGTKIDSNIIKASALNQLCRSDSGWAYRLHRTRVVPKFTRSPELLTAGWMTKIESFIESALACRTRLLCHIRDCRSLLREVRQVEAIEPGISRYLMLEALAFVPLIHLNQLFIVPFQQDGPWNEALRARDCDDPVAVQDYNALVATISQSELFRNLDSDCSYANELRRLLDECRAVVIRHLDNVFYDGYGALLGSAVLANTEVKREILRLMGSRREDHDVLIRSVWNWLDLVRERQRASELPKGPRTALRRRKNRESGTRHIHYDEETGRLKVIMPTGGCRVPTCNFCMLPYLARSKSDVGETLAAIESQRRSGPVRQLTVYTDGSFFDRRELTRDERLMIARKARDLGAEELLVESLPRFLDEKVVDELLDNLGPKCRLRLGVGVQSTDAVVREYITRTPMTQAELRALLKWRKTAPFSLRLYLLANKPLLSAAEDRADVRRSLAFLNEWLTTDDIVTVNPLLPTNGTLVEKIGGAGFWRPLRIDEVKDLTAELRAKSYSFQIEFGPSFVSTCTDLDAKSDSGLGTSSLDESSPAPSDPTSFLPWALLGSMRHRGHWARQGGLQG